MKKSFLEIKKTAGKKRSVSIFLIPYLSDLEHYGGTRTSKLGQELESWGNANDIHVIDLLPAMWEAVKGNATDLFYKCDPHWNKAGSELAAKILLEKLYERNAVRAKHGGG